VAQISGDTAVEILRSAFLPFHFGAEVYDYNAKVRFKVVDESDTSLARVTDITPDEFGDSDRLERLIQQVRSDLTHHKGVTLEAWQMPPHSPDAV
jgi:alpha-D-ribose 1-methylphosphonate 5-triphosphate synthase subunit PhnH